MPFLKSTRIWLTLAMLLATAGFQAEATTTSGTTSTRPQVTLLMEDHGGMREMVWDSAFKDLEAAGPFQKDHRYALRTKGTPGLVDLGCWDGAWSKDDDDDDDGDDDDRNKPGSLPAGLTLRLTADGAGAILSFGGRSTWLPVVAPYSGSGKPMATLRGAYLNWLLANRGTTPSIPRETRWQRMLRGAEAAARELLTPISGQPTRPAIRLLGLGTSGRVLIPQGESLSAALKALGRLRPSSSGSMAKALNRTLASLKTPTTSGPCALGLVLPMGDGWILHKVCGSGQGHEHDDDDDDGDEDGKAGREGGRAFHGEDDDDDDEGGSSTPIPCGTRGRPYETSRDYAAMLATVRAIRDSGKAEVWAWSVEGTRDWSKAFASNRAGRAFSGDAVAALGSALKHWRGQEGQPLQLTLSLDQPPLTRVAQVTLSIRSNHGLVSATLNGQPIQTTGLDTRLPLVLSEGSNTFTILATGSCGTAQASISVTLDTIPPVITLDLPVPVLTAAAMHTFVGRVDDPKAAFTVNGLAVPLDAEGRFSFNLPLVEGFNVIRMEATDLVGNIGHLQAAILRDSTPPVVRLEAPAEGLLTNAAQIEVRGQVDDPSATLVVNGQATPLDASGRFSLTLSPPEGPLTLTALATDWVGLTGQDVRHVVIDRTGPRITLTRPVPGLVALTSLTLQGVVDDPSARLTFNGSTLALDPQGAFLVEASLSEGANAFHFEASDQVGNIGVLDAHTVRDTTPPVVTLESPQDGLITNQRSLLVKGRVDDPTARLLVAGQSLGLAADGSFETTLSPSEGAQLIVALATDPAGNTGHAVRSVTLDWTPPVLVWIPPTPAEGAKVGSVPVAVAATVSESATVLLNGQALPLESGAPFVVKSSLSPAEGPAVLGLEATDRAGNTGRAERRFLVGLTAPKVVIESPGEGLQTRDSSAVLLGRVESEELLKPILLTLNGATVALTADGRFSLPVPLQEGANPFQLVATNAFGHQGRAARILNRYTTPFGVEIEWPLDGLAIPERTVEVRGRVIREGATVAVNGVPAQVDSATLVFKVTVPLQPGLNTLIARATDGTGNQGQAQVRVTCAPPGDPAATYRWDLPANGASSRKRMIQIQGQADLPGVTSVKINGLPMALSGVGEEGRFTGEVPLEARGRNVLLLEARTLAGATLSERREVSFVPDLPRIRLQAPDTARPGDSIPIQVSPEPGTLLKTVDISWNGRFLATVAEPFAPVTAQVPGDALVGTQIPVEALATDAEGEQVTSRTYVTVYGLGALLVEAYDDRQGLPMKEGLATVEGGESQALDAAGRAALRTALPQNWIQVSRNGHTPVWRSAGLQVGGVQALVDARLTPLAEGQPASASTFAGRFGLGALELAFPAGAFSGETTVSGTPLSTQGLPGLLPMGWSALSAWWIHTGSLVPAAAGTATLTLPAGAPQENITWARWDQGLHAWITLATGLRTADLTGLPIPGPGGFALVVPDSGLTAPPLAIPLAQLPGYEGPAWREALVATGTVDPSTLPTTAAIRGARATAKFSLGFEGRDPLPSGVLIQADVLESYALLDSALIEPDGFTQDAVATRWMLGVNPEGAPTLKAAQDLGLELPIRMSRTFQINELVEGRIWVGFYHDGVQVAQSGSELLDATGGEVSRDGIHLTVPARALTGTTLIRLNADRGDVAPLWPELAGQGTLLKSFQLDIVGLVQQGLQLRFEDLGLIPPGLQPLLLQRRVVQGERLVVAVGALQPMGSGWKLQVPEGGNPLLEGGAFAVLLPAAPWDWISGTALLPGNIAQPLMQKLGAKARMMSVQQLASHRFTPMNTDEKMKANPTRNTAPTQPSAIGVHQSSSVANPSFPMATPANAPDDVAVADVVVRAGFLQAVSGLSGAFAVPAFPPPGATLTLQGERRDLGVKGALESPVPSARQTLRLSQVPFKVMTILPAELAEVGVGSVLEVLLSTAADPATLDRVKLYQEVPATPSHAPPIKGSDGPLKAKASQVAQPSVAQAKSSRAAQQSASKAKQPLPPKGSKKALSKQALQAVEGPQLVEVAIRRTLSQDGRSLLLTPETPLQPGATYRVVTTGLASLGGEVAPAFTRRVKTQSKPQFADVDLSRIKLSYPNEAFDVTVTIPEGAVPPWSIVSVEAPDMGSFGQGVMPPTGDLVFQLKANLGERLKVTVQVMDGRSLQGTLGRYVAEDGRTTLGPDGGRVEGPGGFAMVVPEGAIQGSAELVIEPMTTLPAVPEGAVLDTERLMPGLQIRSKGPIDFQKPPVFELPLSVLAENVDTRPGEGDGGNGPLALFRTEKRTLPDGTEDEYSVLMDTAEIRDTPQGRKIISLGGLRLNDPQAGTVVAAKGFALSPRYAPFGQSASLTKAPGKNGDTTPGKASNPERSLVDYSPSFGGIYLWGAWAPSYEAPPPQYRYHSGTVYRNWNGNGDCGGTASASCYGPLASAEVHRYRGTTGLDAARKGRLAKGRMLATCDTQGRYLSVGGPGAEALPGQTWIALFAVDPRTGETSIDPGSPTAKDLGLPWERRNHSIAITSQGGNPFDPALTAPRIRAMMVDATGTVRTMFTVGETATLRISTESGSQAVVRGKVSGGITQEFGTLPVDLPVSFTQEGTWKADILGWTAKPVQGAASLSIIVTPEGKLGPSLPGKPGILSKEPEQGDKDLDPSTVVKITFTEPVRGATTSAFTLNVNGSGVPFKVVSNAREVSDAGTLVQQVWLMPDQRLPLGGKVEVRVSSFITDQDGEALVPVIWSFTVRGADEVGTLSGVGTFSRMVAHKGKIYAVEDVGTGYYFDGETFQMDAGMRKHGIRVLDTTDPSNPKKGPIFGEYRSWDPPSPQHINLSLAQGPFSKSSISGIRVVPGVSIGGKARDVLLVATEPWSAQEILVAGYTLYGEYYPTVYRIRHNAIWAFDITDDAEATEVSMGNTIPKLLMSTSQGTLSENWIKGLGGAGGVLGSIRLRGGMTLWDGGAWKASWDEDQAAQSDWTIRYRTAGGTGYYPSPQSLVGSNGFYGAATGRFSVTSGVVSEDAQGRPIGFATMGYAQGYLIAIDGKVGDPMSMATFSAGGPYGLDSRMHDLSPSVNSEYASKVEVLKGTWQGPGGTEQGTLLLVGTQPGGSAATQSHFWVLNPDLSDMTKPGAAQYAKAILPGRITRIIGDSAKMLVGVEASGKVYVFDLKVLQPNHLGPMQLTPIFDFAVSGAWTLDKGMLIQTEGSTVRRLVVKNLDGVSLTPKLGIPLLVDANQFFAGAFYDYNSSVLGNPNPTPQPQMPEKLVYALTDMQGNNGGEGKVGGYPSLRHYYPDLGEMQISGVVNVQDPKQFLDATRENSPWFMEAEAKLYDGDTELSGAVIVEGLTISGNQRVVAGNGTRRSKIFGDGDRALEELRPNYHDKDGNISYPAWQKKFAYSPFKFYMKPDVLIRMDQDLRLDFKERFRVKVELKLYKDENQRASGPPEATLKTFEFAVKFNSNTRLFDVLRGGVWYFDPVVAGSDPSDTSKNPFTVQWLNRLVDAKGEPVDVSGIFKTRLSLTPGVLVQKGTVFDDVVFNRDMVVQGSDSLAWIGLDVVQGLLNDSLPKMRRQFFEGQRNTRMTPFSQRFRSTFGDAPMDEKGRLDLTTGADVPGAFGHRMAHVVNSVQMFSEQEAGTERSLNDPRTWSPDPTSWAYDSRTQKGDLDPEDRPLRSRIRPLVNQHLKNGSNFNAGNVLVGYLTAYPRLRTQGSPANGLYPINTMLTRDLLVGPMGLSTPGFEAQRAAIDTSVRAFNVMPSPWEIRTTQEEEGYCAKVRDESNLLLEALKSQQIVTDEVAMTTGTGSFFNLGTGLLQAGLQERWHSSPAPADPEYRPGAWNNPHLYAWADNLSNMNYESDPTFNLVPKAGVMRHLMKHLGSNRVDVYINGVQNVPEELEDAAHGLQQQLEKVESLAPNAEFHQRVPVIAVYNSSAKRYFGGNDENDLFDGSDLFKQKRETTLADQKTTNPDAIKLIGVLKALVENLWSRDYEIRFYLERLKGQGLPTEVWSWTPDGPQSLDLVRDCFAAGAVQTGNGWQDVMTTRPIAPKTKSSWEEEYPVTPGLSAEQALVERKALFERSAAAFKPIAVSHRDRLRQALDGIQATLHAHSQGAIVAAVVHNRLGKVPRGRSITLQERNLFVAEMDFSQVSVASQIHYVGYGGAANMLDWGTYSYFRTYAHHINEKDGVTFPLGMLDPFQNHLRMGIPLLFKAKRSFWIKLAAKGSAATDELVNTFNPHFLKVLTGPSKGEREAWRRGDHAVIVHNSKAARINIPEHNFVKAYLCAVGTEKKIGIYPRRYDSTAPLPPLGLPMWFWLGDNPKAVTGDVRCPDQ